MTDEEAYIERKQPDYRPPESEPPVSSNRLLADIHARLLAQSEQWRTNTNDPYNINTAVSIALLEVANVFSCALNDDAVQQQQRDYGPSSSKCSGCGVRYDAEDAYLHTNCKRVG